MSKNKNSNFVTDKHPSKNNQNNKIVHQQHLSFSGPLPPPDILKKYDEVLPVSAERILKMAETQSFHRRNLESNSLDAQIEHIKRRDSEAKLGQFFAFIIAMTAIICGLYGITHGAPIAGSFISLSGLGTIIGAFIYGREKTKNRAKEKKAGE